MLTLKLSRGAWWKVETRESGSLCSCDCLFGTAPHVESSPIQTASADTRTANSVARRDQVDHQNKKSRLSGQQGVVGTVANWTDDVYYD